MSAIIATNLVKQYGTGNAAVTALDNVGMHIASGEFVAIMGKSGSGKSTLLSILGALNTPSSGTCVVDDLDIYDLTQDQRADFRREYLGFVFQSFHLLPYLNVMENVMIPLAVINEPRKSKEDRALKALAEMGLENKARRLPNEISGGEQERVAIARAVVNDPPIILADEPTGNLDSKTGSEVMALLGRLNAKGRTIVMVTHSEDNARHAGRILRLADGRLLQ
ncbi:putative ABC transport system ATP-binding protein [Desulfonatronum thiosulfatophilum]|uniref:Putative ABC transport system ATP-binding protein n=1 Tax=Desulfonatronum thiosulfatophilum TaxID=617002 RepID=A0A1G6C110_9BACT|nr:ABC transporter ATP-binding protein [Desulfonatronum thiosulfatophilum]SDB26569.1 putative ABC transport system ATP-binding protein [Desulfonatronum thiosulfatophilum]